MSEPPRRIQRRRTKGWRMPPNTVYAGRPGPLGNPFDWVTFGRAGAVDFFRRWLAEELTPEERASTGIDLGWNSDEARRTLLARLSELRGKDLACWCPLDEPCHVDVLLERANR